MLSAADEQIGDPDGQGHVQTKHQNHGVRCRKLFWDYCCLAKNYKALGAAKDVSLGLILTAATGRTYALFVSVFGSRAVNLKAISN